MSHAEAKSASGVGASLLRKEDARHLHGRGQFVSDVRLPGTQDVAFVRSPHAHARIKGITIPPEAAGCVFTARDLPRLAEMRAVPQVSGFKVSGYPPLSRTRGGQDRPCAAHRLAYHDPKRHSGMGDKRRSPVGHERLRS